MKLSELLLEYGSSNPFVGIVSAIDLQARAVREATRAVSDSSIYISSLKGQLSNLVKFLDTGLNWVIPDSKLRSSVHAALPAVKRHVFSAVGSVESGSFNKALDHLLSARNVAIKYSHLHFGGL